MPNWCDNKLEVSGPKEDISRFMAAIRNDNPDATAQPYEILTRLVPMPEILVGSTSPAPDSPDPHPGWGIGLAEGRLTPEMYADLCEQRKITYLSGVLAKEQTGHSDWWSWQQANWGVKWGDQSTRLASISSTGTRVTFQFDTPWGPAVEGFQKISLAYPTLTFVMGWHEPGCEVLGAGFFRNGKVSRMSAEYPEMEEVSDKDETAWEEAWQRQWDEVVEIRDALMEQVTPIIYSSDAVNA